MSGKYHIKMKRTNLQFILVNNELSDVQRFKVTLNNNSSLGGYNVELCYLNFFYAFITFVGALVSFLVQVIMR